VSAPARSLTLPPIDVSHFDAGLLVEARLTWADRVRTEWRSVQILTRWVTELTATVEPLPFLAGAAQALDDEIHHVALCSALCEALGGRPERPAPSGAEDATSLRLAPAERPLATAIVMLVVNETLSVAYLQDLAARCDAPAVRFVLDGLLADELGHRDLGGDFVRHTLPRRPAAERAEWRAFARRAVEHHRHKIDALLARVPPERRALEHFPDAGRAALGMTTPVRQALVFEETLETTLRPRLAALDLA
jgi:hypothetical protein